MKKILTVFLITAGLVSCFSSFAQTEDANYLDGQLFIKLKDSVLDTINLSSPVLLPLEALYNVNYCRRPFAGLGNDTLDRIYKIKFTDTAHTKFCMDTLRNLPIIDYVERVPLYKTSFVPNDPDLSQQYNLQKINAVHAWNISKGSANVVIAIVDNAELETHQDLAANITGGYDVADNDANTSPPAGFTSVFWNHGTHCTGIASAVTDNSMGIASIGYNTKIMPIKCTPDTSVSGDDIYYADEGVTYAMQNNANIISMSYGSYGSALSEQILMETAINKGIVLVSAAGNNDSSLCTYPAAYNGVICVGATDSGDVKPVWSNYGSQITVMAPGNSVLSTFAWNDSAYATFTGTSMSCPLVAGLAALILAQNPSYSPADVTNTLETTADNIDAENPNFSGQLGAGRINAFHALGGVGTGIEAIGNTENIKIFPNPFSDQVEIQSSSGSSPVRVQIFNSEGQIVLDEQPANMVNPVLNTGNLPAGVYTVRVIDGSGNNSERLVKI